MLSSHMWLMPTIRDSAEIKHSLYSRELDWTMLNRSSKKKKKSKPFCRDIKLKKWLPHQRTPLVMGSRGPCYEVPLE